MTRSFRVALVAAALLAPIASLSAQPISHSSLVRRSAASESEAGRRTLTPAELRRVYADRTWAWSDGGGYFAQDGTFVAAVGRSAKSAYIAHGSWTAGNQGEVCFWARWQGRAVSANKRTCFFHEWRNRDLMQKKEADGEWYVFKNARTEPGDEYNKLAPGYRVAGKIDAVHREYLSGIPLFFLRRLAESHEPVKT